MPLVACNKGCGENVFVQQETIAEALVAGVLSFAHDVCPRDKTIQNEYVLGVFVHRVVDGVNVELLATSAKIFGLTLTETYPRLVTELAANLTKLEPLLPTAEEGLDDDKK